MNIESRNYFVSNELLPTDDNINHLLEHDLYGRNKYIKIFIDLIDNINYSCSIALDGQWGSGKTIFVKQIINKLKSNNPIFGNSSNMEYNHSFLPIYYDAWENDNVNDPILSIINTVLLSEKIDKKNVLKKNPGFLKSAAAFVSLISGAGISEYYEKAESEDLLAPIKDISEIQKQIIDFLNNCIEEKADRLVIFVDELDRCRPDFAVKTLERIKHYFCCKNVIFVFSINSTELISTIKSFYGNEFSAYRYLDRFFDFRINLPKIPVEDYIRNIGLNDNFVHIKVAKIVMEELQMSTREIEKYVRLINATCGKMFDQNGHSLISDEYTNFFYMYYLPIALGLKIININEYARFVSGNNFEMLKVIVLKKNSIQNILSLFHTSPEQGKELEKIEEIYKQVLSETNRYHNTFQEILGLFSDYSSQSYDNR